MNEGKKKASIWILGILTIILVGVIVFLTLSIIKQKENEKELTDQVQALSQQKTQIENELKHVKDNLKNEQQKNANASIQTDSLKNEQQENANASIQTNNLKKEQQENANANIQIDNEKIKQQEERYARRIIDDYLYDDEINITALRYNTNLLDSKHKFYIAVYATIQDENMNRNIENGTYTDESSLPEGVVLASGIAIYRLSTLNKYYNEIFGESVTENDLLSLNTDRITAIKNGIVYGSVPSGSLPIIINNNSVQLEKNSSTYSSVYKITENGNNSDKEYNVKFDYNVDETGKSTLTSLTFIK